MVQGVILLLAATSLALFASDHRREQAPQAPQLSQIFSNPYLRVFAILLMVLVVLSTEGDALSLPGVVILIIGTTVAGADFILLLVALIKGDHDFMREYFALEREKLAKIGIPVVEPAAASAVAAEPKAEKAAASRAGIAIDDARQEPLRALIEQDALKQLRVAEAQALVKDGAPIRVALLSAGVRQGVTSHAALSDRVETPYVVPGAASGEVAQAMAPVAEAAIGHVAAIAPSARILPVSVFTEAGGSSDELLQGGMQAAVQWAPHVVLFDLGSPEPLAMLKQLIERHGDVTLLIAPAGNSGTSSPEWPASERKVMAVAAEAGSDRRLAPFSSFGRGVRVAAPGLDLLSVSGTNNGELAFAPLSGTSLAAAVAAGVTALALSADPGLDPATLRKALEETGHPVVAHRSMRGIDAANLLERVTGSATPAGVGADGPAASG